MISVLYVDDEPVLLDMGKRFLEKSGKLKVDTFLSAEIAVKILTPSRYDAIISDYKMPGMDGLDFLSAVRTIQPDLPFIVFTGQGGEDIAIEALNRGADFYLQKGGNPKTLYGEIENFIINIVGREFRKGEILAEKKASEQALSLLQTLYAYAPFGFAYVDRNYVFIHVNDALADIRFLSRTDLLGRTLEEMTPSLWKMTQPLFQQVIISGKPALNKEMTAEIPLGSGIYRNWLVSLYPVFGKNGTIMGFGILQVDITERKQIEEALIRSEDRYRMLSESAEDAIFIIGYDYLLTYINSYGSYLFGRSQEDMIGIPISGEDPLVEELIHADVIREVFTSGTGCAYDAEMTTPRSRWMEIRLIPLHGSGGEHLQVMGIARDVSDRKNAENALLNANRKLNLLSSITRHDIINQLSFLFIDLDTIRDIMYEHPEGKELFDRVNLAIRTIHHLIEFTREYQEIGIGSPIWQNLHEIIGRSYQSLRFGEIRIEEKDTQVEIRADALFEKVIYNIMDNAIRYGNTITRISCSVLDNPSPMIVFEDDGDGILDSDKEKIFSLGFGQNTGFGLFISREILSITNMSITETGKKGSGARFEIRIPPAYIRPAL
jgi:PAS domain S-box-containing protein